MEQLNLVTRAKTGDLDAWRLLVEATQSMACAVAVGVLHDLDMAQDAAQEAYLRAFRSLADLEEPAAFINWLRRIVITVAANLRKASRTTLLRLDDVPVMPVLDEAETSWSEAQRRLLAGALLTLTGPERRLCDRRYHGHWSTARLAKDAGVDEAVMRKRLQHIRDKLRKEMEMRERRDICPEDLRTDLPAKIVELLTRPKLTDLPENPVALCGGTSISVLAVGNPRGSHCVNCFGKGSVKESSSGGPAKRLVSACGEFWCKMLHKNVSMPIFGHYRCLRCNRVYPVLWEKPSRPSLRAVRGIRLQPLARKDLRNVA